MEYRTRSGLIGFELPITYCPILHPALDLHKLWIADDLVIQQRGIAVQQLAPVLLDVLLLQVSLHKLISIRGDRLCKIIILLKYVRVFTWETKYKPGRTRANSRRR